MGGACSSDGGTNGERRRPSTADSFDDDAESTVANGCGVRYRGQTPVVNIATFHGHLPIDDDPPRRRAAPGNNYAAGAICHDDDDDDDGGGGGVQSLPHCVKRYDDDDDPDFCGGGNVAAVLALTSDGPPLYGAAAGGTASCGDSVIDLFESTARSGYVHNASFIDDADDADNTSESFVKLPPQRSPSSNATPRHTTAGRPPRSTPKHRNSNAARCC